MSYEPPQPPPPGPPGPPQYNQPPPGGGYGAPPPGSPPPAPGGYGGGGLQPYSAGDAFSYGWGKFQQNVGQMIIATLAIFVGAVVILGLGFFLMTVVLAGSTECSTDAFGYTSCDTTSGLGFFGTMALMALTFGIFFIYAQVVGAGLIRASLNVTNGLPFRTADVFKFDNLGPVIVASILVGLGVMIGSILCYIPGLIFGFFSSYTLYFLVDQNLSPVDAIKASFNFVNKNLGSTIIWYLLSLVIIFVGELLCGVGLLVAIPIVLVGTAYTYKKLNGAPVAP